MRKSHVDAVIIPGTDPHQSEYTSAHWKLRDWVTGFTGSNGTAVVTLTDAGLWTDSRYFLQAEQELEGTGVTMYKEDGGNDPTTTEWLAENLEEGGVLAVNGLLFSVVQASRLEAFCGENGFRFATDFDPFPEIYADRQALPLDKVFVHEEQYAGESTQSKIKKVLDKAAEHGADATLLSALDEIAWTLNVRCSDVEFNPVTISYAYLSDTVNVFFVDERKIDADVRAYLKECGVEVAPYDSVEKFLEKIKDATVLLDPNKTSPFEFYQYWRNVGDADVLKCIRMLTFLPLEQIDEMDHWEGEQLNKAKEILAYELTKMVHGEEEAEKAQATARGLFSGAADHENMPSTKLDAELVKDGGVGLLAAMVAAGLCGSNREARQLVQQGGVLVDGEKVTDPKAVLTVDALNKGVVIKKGKKVYHKVVL